MSTHTRFFSTADVQDSIESLERTHGKERPIIYWMFLGTMMLGLGSLFVIQVDLSVGGMGQIRPEVERFQVFPGISGPIASVHVSENQRVNKGDVLLRFESSTLDARIAQNRAQQEDNARALHDLELLLSELISPAGAQWSNTSGNPFTTERFLFQLPSLLQSPHFVREHASFSGECQRLGIEVQKSEADYKRTRSLWEMEVVSDKEHDDQRHLVEIASKQLQMLILQTLGRWQSEKIERDLRQVQLDTEQAQLLEQRELYLVKAPTEGVAMGFKGIHPGLFLPQGQVVGEISPEARLQAEVYVSPRDIGFIREGQITKILVDAFPHTEWGILEGRVRTITQDFVQIGQGIAFRALVDLDRTSLTASSGISVEVRRGMTVNARFVVRRATLFRLLYSKMSDAFDPRDSLSEAR